MAEEIEVPTEHLHESLEEEAAEGPVWVSRVAVTAALLAVLAAIAALFAGHEANEAMEARMLASDQWAFFQAKGIKAAILQSKLELLASLARPAGAGDAAKLEGYKGEQDQIKEKAEEHEQAAAEHLHRHHGFAHTVTTSQIGIALSAIAVLTRKKRLWYVSLVLGLVATGLLVKTML